jgi:hypothetical protein
MNTNSINYSAIAKAAAAKGLKVDSQGNSLLVKAEQAVKRLSFSIEPEWVVVFIEDPTSNYIEVAGEHSCKRLDSLFIEAYLNWYADIVDENKGRLASSLSSMITHLGDLDFYVTTEVNRIRAEKDDITYSIKIDSSDRGANNYFVVARKSYGEIIRIKSDIITGSLLAQAIQHDWEFNSHRFLDGAIVGITSPITAESPIDIITKKARKSGYACDVSKLDLGFETLLGGNNKSMIFVNGRDNKNMVTFVASENAGDTIKVSQRYTKMYEGPNNFDEADYDRFIALAGEPLF